YVETIGLRGASGQATGQRCELVETDRRPRVRQIEARVGAPPRRLALALARRLAPAIPPVILLLVVLLRFLRLLDLALILLLRLVLLHLVLHSVVVRRREEIRRRVAVVVGIGDLVVVGVGRREE